LAIPALADQIVLKNGDKITGSITKSDGKVLVIHTDAAGDLTVKFDAIQSITSAGDLNITLGGKTAVGPVTTTGTDVVVATRAGTPVEAPMSSITLVRSPAEQAAYEKTLHPGFGQGWAGGVNLGFALTAGNSETKNLNIGFNAIRTGFHDKLILYETTNYAASVTKMQGEPNVFATTANSNSGGFRYDRDINPRTFGFVSGDFFSNSLQDLDLRSVFGGGIGFHAIKKPNTTLDLLAGLNYTHESFSGLTNPNPPPSCVVGTEPSCRYSHSDSAAALTVGDNFMHKFGKSTVFTQSFLLYPSLSQTTIALPNDLSEQERVMRGALNLGLVTKLNKWLGWQTNLGDVFDNHPPFSTPAIERNDITFATGLNISFTH
jgi:hypothetical protein